MRRTDTCHIDSQQCTTAMAPVPEPACHGTPAIQQDARGLCAATHEDAVCDPVVTATHQQPTFHPSTSTSRRRRLRLQRGAQRDVRAPRAAPDAPPDLRRLRCVDPCPPPPAHPPGFLDKHRYYDDVRRAVHDSVRPLHEAILELRTDVAALRAPAPPRGRRAAATARRTIWFALSAVGALCCVSAC